jgi:hypothetical protein
MRVVRNRLAKAFAGAFLASLIVVGPLGLQGANAAVLDSFSGAGTGYALRVTLDLSNLQKVPVVGDVLNQAWAALGKSGPIVIDQFVIKTTSDATNELTKAVSVLGEGFTNFGGANATASSMGQSKTNNVANQVLPDASLPLVNIASGLLKAAVSQGPVVNADGALASVTAGLGDLLDSVALPADLQTALDTINDTVNGALGDITDTVAGGLAGLVLDDQTGDLVDAISGLDPTVGGVIGGLLGDLDAETITEQVALDGITDQIASLLDLGSLTDVLSGDLAAVNGLVNKAVAQQSSGSKAVSDASSKLAGIDILGLINVGALNLSSHSEAGGVAGTAKNSSTCTLGDITVGGNDLISLDGTELLLGGEVIPVVDGVVGTVTGLVGTVLDTLGIAGVDADVCDTEEATAASDGTKASQAVSALRIDIAPQLPSAVAGLVGTAFPGLAAGDELFHLTIDPTVQTAVAAQPQVAEAPQPAPSLPRTGAPAAVTMIAGVALTTGALALRRRFSR